MPSTDDTVTNPVETTPRPRRGGGATTSFGVRAAVLAGLLVATTGAVAAGGTGDDPGRVVTARGIMDDATVVTARGISDDPVRMLSGDGTTCCPPSY